jgi:hypothetical protein
MPLGTVNVTCKVKEPVNDCKPAGLRKNDPKLLVPLREPTPNAVVPVKEGLPLNNRGGTPMTVPDVKPEIVTSSARATPWLSVKMAMVATTRAKDFANIRKYVFIKSSVVLFSLMPPAVNPEADCTIARRLMLGKEMRGKRN